MRIRIAALVLLCWAAPLAFTQDSRITAKSFRPPAVPLVVSNPYFSVWSFADHLTYDSTRHWTGTPQPLSSTVQIDGQTYRIMGEQPRNAPPARQVALQVLPTRTIYDFEAAGVDIRLTFMTPLLPDDLEVFSRPVTYLTWNVRALDSKQHKVSISYSNPADLVVDSPEEKVEWAQQQAGSLSVLRMGTAQQPVLAKSGDRIRIDWGYLYAAAPADPSTHSVISGARTIFRSLATTGSLPTEADTSMPRPANENSPIMMFVFDLGNVGAEAVERHLILAYDEVYSIELFHVHLRPYWRRKGAEAVNLLQDAERDYTRLTAECQAFDQKMMTALVKAGGAQYAQLSALAYRQSMGANTLAAGTDGQPLFFLKEISSCGCAQTVDVIYPESPLLLLVNPQLLEYSLLPILDYANSGQWPYPYAPHDLGVYPLDNARDPAKMESMPVEESGNMLLMIAALAKIDGNASFAGKYWPLLTKWAEFLKSEGLDPANQLSTDDFTGHLAHNTNLSLKAVEALGAYALLAETLGKKNDAALYRGTAEQYVRQWMTMADDGDHYRLAFDKPGTWSQKYNLVWDRVLGLNLFPPEVARKELAYYKTHETQFGFPLDSRAAYTKLDWELWSATLAESDESFKSYVSGFANFANESPTRVPLSDWYWTLDGTQAGFQARPVVGALFIKMLADFSTWKAWAHPAR